MGVIIGNATTVNFGGASATQVSWNINPNIQRAYVLGDWSPYKEAEVKAPTEVLNVTVYTPGGVSYDTSPTESCVDANTITVTVSPASCGEASDGPSATSWFATSYSFSKGDARQPGQESWSLMQYVTLGDTDVTLPTYVLRGISEGSITTDQSLTASMSKVGLTFKDSGEVDSGTTGSVSAGQLGRADNVYTGVVSNVGNSSAGSGDVLQASCSMPYTPLYI